MPEGQSSTATTGDPSSETGGIWRGLRTLLFGEENEETLRERIEDAIRLAADPHSAQKVCVSF